MTSAEQALAIARAKEAGDIDFARMIAVRKIQDIRAELHGIERRMPESVRRTPKDRAQRDAFRRAINALAAKPAEFWLDEQTAFATGPELLRPVIVR